MTKHNLTSEQRGELAKKRRAKVQAARNTMNRDVSAAKLSAGLKYVSTGRSVDRQAESLIQMIPPDTRSLTARIAGDPLPGRSALDRQTRGQRI